MKKIKRFQLLRIIIPLLYTALLAMGIIFESFSFMLILTGLALLAGSFFCGWLCPFGVIQEWIGKLGRVMKIPKVMIPEKIEKWIRYSRYILLALTLSGFGLIFFITSPNQTFSGLLTFNIAYLSIGLWLLLGLFLIVSLFIDRPFCRYFCSEGARYGILSLGRLFSIKRNEKTCISCNQCNKKCPMQIKVSGKKHIRNGQCINCFECIAACPVEQTLSFGWVIKNKSNKPLEVIND